MENIVNTIIDSFGGLLSLKYGKELLASGVSNEGLTINEIVYKDFKNFISGDNKFAIGQVFTTDFKEYSDRLDEYINELNKINWIKLK